MVPVTGFYGALEQNLSPSLWRAPFSRPCGMGVSPSSGAGGTRYVPTQQSCHGPLAGGCPEPWGKGKDSIRALSASVKQTPTLYRWGN